MGTQLREGDIQWVADLVGTTATTVYPSGVTAGIAPPNPGRHASRIHVMADYTAASGTMSVMVSVYGYTGNSQVPTTPRWVYLGQLNAGSITADTGKWSESATRIVLAEAFIASGCNFSRYATRAYAPGGVSPVISTWIGFVAD